MFGKKKYSKVENNTQSNKVTTHSYAAKRSTRAPNGLHADGDTWVEGFAVVEKDSKQIVRQYFQSQTSGAKVWDEPPSGASNIKYASEEMRQMAEMQVKRLTKKASSEAKKASNQSANKNKNNEKGKKADSKVATLSLNKKKAKSKKDDKASKSDNKDGKKLPREVKVRTDTDLQKAIAMSLESSSPKPEPKVKRKMQEEDSAMAMARAISISEHEAKEKARREEERKEEMMMLEAIKLSQKEGHMYKEFCTSTENEPLSWNEDEKAGSSFDDEDQKMPADICPIRVPIQRNYCDTIDRPKSKINLSCCQLNSHDIVLDNRLKPCHVARGSLSHLAHLKNEEKVDEHQASKKWSVGIPPHHSSLPKHRIHVERIII